jgi:hypothetical protein
MRILMVATCVTLFLPSIVAVALLFGVCQAVGAVRRSSTR